MTKKILILLFFTSVITSFAQRNQTIAYIDMDYILENVPEYLTAQNTINNKIAKWRSKLDAQARHIEVLKTDLSNEKILLTKDLIEDRENEITLKQEELRRLESLYFGPDGDMFLLRKQLVKPIQDQVYNAIQSIAKRKRYDFVLDKSSDLIMLFSNKKYDISDLILGTINRTKLIKEKKERKKNSNQRNTKNRKTKPKNIKTPRATTKEITSKKEEEIKARQEEITSKKEEERAKKRKAIEEKRKLLLEKREEKRKLLREKKEALRKKKEEQKNKNNNN